MLQITGWDLRVCGILAAGAEVGAVGHILGSVQTSAWVLGEDREQAGSFAVVLTPQALTLGGRGDILLRSFPCLRARATCHSGRGRRYELRCLLGLLVSEQPCLSCAC